ncbi:MAG: bifunctional diguanylate cyclase/phosphodiesterase [Mycobacteriales bacterium]|nr:bifunctional diguanylate cyclase/phosphodiesterase [Mycobacteriales bacterium]
MGVLFVDLDGFKEVNDSLGHDAGDALLEAVSARLRGVCRAGELLTRLGGDEFVVCLSRLREVGEAERAAARLLAALEEPVAIPGRVVEVSGSCGVAVGSSADGATPGLLLRDADTALYEAKASGRARVVTFEPALRARDERRRRLQADLAEALRTGSGLALVYQPIADATTGELVLAEALLRWQHPVDGALAPGDFLGLAADRGLLPDLDRWVVGRACAQAAEWQRAGLSLAVSVNVTPGSVEDGAVVAWVRDACSATGLDPGRLVIELTETAVVERPQETSVALAALRAMGVRIALDDFGTGYSSMSHLRDLPVDIVKIDRSFTAGTVRSAREAAIVEATTRLALALGATTIAEGVETAAEQAAVIAAGCVMLQGWHIARPLEPAALTLLLAGGLPAPRPALVSVTKERSA